jgi:membrane associated rhomboid family serine protease
MLDLNHILLFVATVSPALLLVQTWRGAANPHWRKAALSVLVVTAIAWLLARGQAGFIGAGAWFFLLFLPATTMRKSLELAQRGNVRGARRLVALLRFMHIPSAVREHAYVIDVIERAQQQGRPLAPAVPRPSMFGRTRTGVTTVVAILLVLNLAMFVAQTALGGSTNPLTLHRLGALEPWSVLAKGEYWRLLTALFLHYGAAHLVVNMFALYFFGPTLEEALGSLRFAACYLLSGVGSCVEIATLWHFRLLELNQLVGASAAVMGIVGAWAGSLIRDRHVPHHRRTLRSILIIIVVQVVYDALTPHVSMAAHLTGLATGFLLGLLLAPRPNRPRDGTLAAPDFPDRIPPL